MRIAVSGSHSLEKSTVVNDWVSLHGDYMREEDHFDILPKKDQPSLIELVGPLSGEGVLQLAQAVDQLQAKKSSDEICQHLGRRP
jgi:hypothetical protein